MHIKQQLLCAAALLSVASTSYAQKICVFDPLGTQGDGYAFMKDYALAAKQWGADITLKPYTDDQHANDDFKDGKCDGLSTLGIRARQFNSFTGSIDSLGAVPDETTAKIIITLMANPKLATDMVSGDTEVVGVSAVGGAYPMTDDRNINSMAKMSGKNFGALNFDKAQSIVAEKLGCTVVPISLTSLGNKFNSGQLDIVAVPALAFKAFELNKGMGNKGAIAKYVVAYMTSQILVHPTKFPDGYGAQSRTWIAGQLTRQLKTAQRIDSSIDARYWMELPPSDKLGYDKLFRQTRISLTREGVYNKRMQGILKKTRCIQNPTNYECVLTDE
jgi:hypothetical protein